MAVDPELFAYVGSVLLVVSGAPQLVKILQTRSAEGVSVATWLLILATTIAWAWYGIRTGSMPQIPGNTITAVITIGIVVFSLRIRGNASVRSWAPVVAVVACTFAVFALTSAAVAAISGIVLAVASRVPQMLESWHSMRQGLATTVSIPTWLLIFGGQGAWLIYGVMANDVPVIWVNVLVQIGAGVIVGLEMARPGRRAEVSGV